MFIITDFVITYSHCSSQIKVYVDIGNPCYLLHLGSRGFGYLRIQKLQITGERETFSQYIIFIITTIISQVFKNALYYIDSKRTN